MTSTTDRAKTLPDGVRDAMEFTLIEALLGRRSRRFALGAEIPDGPLQFKSRHDPMPLSDLEQLLLLTATGGNTGWHYMIYRHPAFAPELANFSLSAGGRTYPSAAGFHTSNLFFTDDDGVYYFDTRDAPALKEQDAPDGAFDLEGFLDAHRQRIRKLEDGRLKIPARAPHMLGPNTWCVNVPGSTMIIPVVDLSQQLLATLALISQSGACIVDDINGQPIEGIEKFGDLIDVERVFPLSAVEQQVFSDATAEVASACYAGTLMIQAMGLGGWLFSGVQPVSTFGASGDPEAPGLRFHAQTDDRWALPNPTGLPGVFEGYCPPHYSNMREAVDSLVERKFGEGGPFDPNTPGPWKDTRKIRGSAKEHNEEFKELLALQAQHILDRFGKFPATVPTMHIATSVQAHHLDTDFYDQYYDDGAYLRTHANHMERWHPGD